MKNSDLNVLLVDDDLMSLESLRSFLSSEGYSIEAHTGIDAAWEACEHKNFDIVASDYMLKDANGLDLLNHVKLIQPDTYTILFTGYSSAEVLSKLEDFKIDLFLTKPIVLKELIELFEDLKIKKGKLTTS
ncbi:response regulator [Candidatus Cloacimonadota bacterium]